ncbi:hypothetical protein HAX54_004762 [Datura stramonium]|uniref:Uncharacterized protein n=1 Tax=Datura stramonium TaxID=4076 RepID=A0ABS8T8J2_DATST|nr:hypothetical protein [Datura stramonium]
MCYGGQRLPSKDDDRPEPDPNFTGGERGHRGGRKSTGQVSRDGGSAGASQGSGSRAEPAAGGDEELGGNVDYKLRIVELSSIVSYRE